MPNVAKRIIDEIRITLIDAALKLKQGGSSKTKAMQVIAMAAQSSLGADDAKAVLDRAKIIFDTESDEQTKLSTKIRDWILDQSVTPGVTFSVTQCDNELGIVTPRYKNNRRQVFYRLVKEKLIEPWGKKAGLYRIVSHETEDIDFLYVPDEGQALNLIFPLFLHKRFELYPGSIIIISGESNAGKTAMMLNLARLNLGRLPITYFGSSAESNARTLNKRVRDFGDPMEVWSKMRAVRRAGDFADVIDPDGLNLIDYLELTGAQGKEFYLVGEEISRIHEALEDGIAVVGLQHKPGSDYAVGGHMTIHKATVSMSLHAGSINNGMPHTLRFNKIKYPTSDDAHYPIKFRLGGGCHFKAVE